MKEITINILQGDCIERMKKLASNSVGSCICDPPYGISFMNKDFDKLGDGEAQREWHKQWLKEVYRILKKGGVIKAFSATRTYHHLAMAMEEVNFKNITISAWCYGSGFPKSLNISKSIDRMMGAERETQGYTQAAPKSVQHAEERTDVGAGSFGQNGQKKTIPIQNKPATELATQFDGYGTALKPAWEPFVVGIKQ